MPLHASARSIKIQMVCLHPRKIVASQGEPFSTRLSPLLIKNIRKYADLTYFSSSLNPIHIRNY